MKNYILVLTLPEKVVGYWDGGEKNRFEFQLQGVPHRDEKGYFVKVGSCEANFWANVTLSKSIKKTLSNVKRRFKAPEGATWEYIETEPDFYVEKFFEVVK